MSKETTPVESVSNKDLSILAEARTYVSNLLTDKLPDYFLYHNHDHTMAVVDACLELAEDLQLNETDKELLTLAAYFHDMGFVETIHEHEEKSKEIASAFLTEKNYPPEKIQLIREMIKATCPGEEPKSILQQILKDADLSSLASDQYDDIAQNLRREWALTLGRHYSELEWLEENTRFLSEHEYYTKAAKERYGEGKNKNLVNNKKALKKARKKWKKSVRKKLLTSDITSSKSAQMMFKTSLRNHIDLTNIADNKANIMLSINALLITISMPILGTYIQDNLLILIPSSILLVTSVLSIIYATLATRPIRMYGYTSLEKIKNETTNLFFFGNFYNMKLSEYQEGMSHVLADVNKLDRTIMTDLYYLGKALGRKYYQLRICYSIFMIGITLSVVSFAITFMIQPINFF